VHIVDSAVAKVANKLVRIAHDAPGGKENARALVDAANYISRIAALPCGVMHMAEYLAGPDVSDRTRAAFDWPLHLGAVNDFEQAVGVGDDRSALLDCLAKASSYFGKYNQATPFAHKLAELVANAAGGKRRSVAVVFTNALYRRLAERFLQKYDQYPEGVQLVPRARPLHVGGTSGRASGWASRLDLGLRWAERGLSAFALD
jgi:hypothetical protein